MKGIAMILPRITSVNGKTGDVTLNYIDVNAPSATGENASGKWGIDISGKANSANAAETAGLANSVRSNPFRSKRDFVNGTLITTDLDGGRTNSSIAFYLQITGNGYNSGTTIFVQAQGYVYQLGAGYSQYISTYATAIGIFADYIQAFSNSNGQLCFWFPRVAYWQGYDIICYSETESIDTQNLYNHVISVTDSALPSNRSWTTQINVVKR